MLTLTRRSLSVVLCLVLCACFYTASATHIVGAEFTYKFLGVGTGGNSYQLHLTIYEDCLNGNPSAIEADSLAFLTVDDGNFNCIAVDTVPYTSTEILPPNFSSSCVANIPLTCLRRKDYFLNLTLPPNTTGYTVTYQRCCRNAAILNIFQPANSGTTCYCSIPPVSLAAYNNSAVFNYYPPQVICVNTPLLYNNSATDPDGDSLSYELCASLSCPNTSSDNDTFEPPYQYATYLPPYSYSAPLIASPPFAIDPVTGFISGTPTQVGRYLITVCCNEWRNGAIINTVKREFQFVITDCSKNVIADIPLLANYPNTFELNCKNYTINFINTSTGGFAWQWDFGVPGVPQSAAFEPTFVYPDTGTYNVKLVANPGSPCADSVIRLVRIYPVFLAQFATGDTQCAGVPIHFIDHTIDSSNSTTGWEWLFGDGGTSALQNPVHTYASSGLYNVVLECGNERGCADTALRQVIVDNFKPFAGNDTTVVKGVQVQFAASGGISYQWSPDIWLENTGAYNPVGVFPDTGQYAYSVQVTSPYGCVGYDTVIVTVVDHGSFCVPNAFTPNGDGKNDVFKPYAVGYRTLNYLRIFNRWGEEVFFSDSFDAGWDGTWKNKPADMGAYYWEISYTDRLGNTGNAKGDVLLIR